MLGTIAALSGFNVLRLLHYIKSELLLVLATSSSESALIPLMEKLERWGSSKSVVGLVVPTGYSFNLDGTNIYMTMASLFIAQALGDRGSRRGSSSRSVLVAMITTRERPASPGSGFITLAATLPPWSPASRSPGMALILGIDKFMSEARAINNDVGNCVAAVVMAAWEKEIDWDVFHAEMKRGPHAEPAVCSSPSSSRLASSADPGGDGSPVEQGV